MSGPSGVGKGSVVRRLLERRPEGLRYSISLSTRRPRRGEHAARDYHFVVRDEFDERVRAGDFLEWAEVFGHRYGTLRAPIEEALASGEDILLEIDVQGARQVREQMPDAVLIFLVPPSPDELERRLRARRTEDEPSLARRLARAGEEIAEASRFDHVVVNDDLEEATEEVAGIIQGYRSRTDRPGAS